MPSLFWVKLRGIRTKKIHKFLCGRCVVVFIVPRECSVYISVVAHIFLLYYYYYEVKFQKRETELVRCQLNSVKIQHF